MLTFLVPPLKIGPILAKGKVISWNEGKVLSLLAGLRNILVHSYSDVDHEILFSLLDKVGEMEDLMGKLFRYMEKEGIDP